MKPPARWQSFAYGVPALMTVGVMSVVIVPQYIKESAAANPKPFTLTLHEDSWRVAYHDPLKGQVEGCEKDPQCPAHPGAEFWFNAGWRKETNHTKTLDRMNGKVFWIGNQISNESVQKLREAGADHLLVGYLYGKYDIWVNGEHILNGDHRRARDPVVVRIPKTKFQESQAFFVSVRIINDMDDPFPDTLSISGFGTLDQIELHRRWVVFWTHVTTSIAFGLNLALGLFFFALWIYGVRQQEVASLATFAFLQALIQGATTSIVWHNLGLDAWHRLNFVNAIYGGASVVLLALALARVRTTWALISPIIVLGCPWLIFFSPQKSGQIFFEVAALNRFLPLSCYLVATFICFGQFRLVSNEMRAKLIDPSRLIKLNLSWITFLFMAIVQVVGLKLQADTRFYNTLLLVILGAGIVNDYGKEERSVQKGIRSKYHLDNKVSPYVEAFLVGIEFKMDMSSKVSGLFLQETVSDLFSKIEKLGGTIIRSGSMSLIYFFDGNRDKNALELAVNSVQTLARSLPAEMSIRAAVGDGEIRPIWVKEQGRDVPAWVQTGSEHAFIDLSTFLDAEMKLGLGEGSFLVMGEPLARECEVNMNWISRDINIRISGKELHVAVAPLGGVKLRVVEKAAA